ADVGRIGGARLGGALQLHVDDQPQPRPREPAADPGSRRRTHLHHGARRAGAPRLQRSGQGEDAAGRVRGHPDADGHGHLQRPHANQLDRTADAVAVGHSLTSRQRRVPCSPPVGGISMLMRLAGPLAALALVLAAPRPARAQANVTPSDVQRLQDSIYDASRDVAQMRSRDGALASQLQSELDDAREEATYLKVKLRKNEPIARSEYAELRDRIEN